MVNGLLFFPITPYRGNGAVDLEELAAHVGRGVDAGAGGVAGHKSGGVRPPLAEVSPEHREELARILAAGLAVAEQDR